MYDEHHATDICWLCWNTSKQWKKTVVHKSGKRKGANKPEKQCQKKKAIEDKKRQKKVCGDDALWTGEERWKGIGGQSHTAQRSSCSRSEPHGEKGWMAGLMERNRRHQQWHFTEKVKWTSWNTKQSRRCQSSKNGQNKSDRLGVLRLITFIRIFSGFCLNSLYIWNHGLIVRQLFYEEYFHLRQSKWIF